MLDQGIWKAEQTSAKPLPFCPDRETAVLQAWLWMGKCSQEAGRPFKGLQGAALAWSMLPRHSPPSRDRPPERKTDRPPQGWPLSFPWKWGWPLSPAFWGLVKNVLLQWTFRPWFVLVSLKDSLYYGFNCKLPTRIPVD